MGITSTILTVGSAVYSQVEANQQRQKAKGAAAAILRSAPNQAQDNANAQAAALDAERRQRAAVAKKQGYGSTLLTGGAGIPVAPGPVAGKKELLGS